MKQLKWKLRTFSDIDYDNINPGLLLMVTSISRKRK